MCVQGSGKRACSHRLHFLGSPCASHPLFAGPQRRWRGLWRKSRWTNSRAAPRARYAAPTSRCRWGHAHPPGPRCACPWPAAAARRWSACPARCWPPCCMLPGPAGLLPSPPAPVLPAPLPCSPLFADPAAQRHWLPGSRASLIHLCSQPPQREVIELLELKRNVQAKQVRPCAAACAPSACAAPCGLAACAPPVYRSCGPQPARWRTSQRTSRRSPSLDAAPAGGHEAGQAGGGR